MRDAMSLRTRLLGAYSIYLQFNNVVKKTMDCC